MIRALPLLALLACGADDTTDSAPETTETTETGDSGETTDTTDTGIFGDHEVGDPAPPFAYEDINPASASYGQVIRSEDLAGAPYLLIFLDSRCQTCDDVARDIWALYEAHPTWWDCLPAYSVARSRTIADYYNTVEEFLVGHALPYLAETPEPDFWVAWEALNHDFFVVSATGTLDAWLPLYEWPDQLGEYTDYVTPLCGE